MGERHTHSKKTVSYGATVAALVCLAGTAQAVAQGTAPRTAAQPPAPANPAASQAPKGNGKLIMQAGNDGLRNPLGKGGQPAATGDDKVKVDENLIVDLHVNDEDLANVLQMLSIQSQRNIVTSKNVSAVVTANLYGVTFWEALDAILHVNGYGYIEKGNFIFVYTLDELQKIEEQQRHQVWKVLKLNYLTSTDAGEFVKPLLSPNGQIKVNGKTAPYVVNSNAPTGGDDFAQSSTMMVFDYEENLAEIEKVIKEIDTRPAQVLVEATILQTTLNEANAFGVDFSVIGDLDFTNFLDLGGPLKAVDGLIGGSTKPGGSGGSSGSGSGSGSGTTSGGPLPADGRGVGVVSSPGNTAGPGTLKLGVVWNDVAAFVRLLDEVADTTIISRPNVLTLNRMPGHVLVGRKVGYLNTTSTDTSTTQTVEFLDTGTQLHFRPFVANDGMIRMELKPKVSEAVIRNVTNSGGAAVTIPDEISNELTTNVMVRDGQTIVLGGLFREATSSSRRQVPGLGDVPLIGAAFRGHDDKTERSEIIFMITPSIVSDQVLLDQGKRGEAMVERVRAGAREGLLPWSREKRTQQLVLEASQLMQEGKRDQALYKVQRALTLNHNMAEAIQLREQLTGKMSDLPTRSMQHEIITGELERRGGVRSGFNSGSSRTTFPPSAPRPQAVKPAPTAARPSLTVVDQPEPISEMPAFTPSPSEPEPMFDPGMEPDPSTEPAMDPEPTFDPNDPIFNTPPATTPSTPSTSPGTSPKTGAAVDPSSFDFMSEPNGEPTTDAAAAPAMSDEEFLASLTPASSPATKPAQAHSGFFGFRGFWGAFRTATPSAPQKTAGVTEPSDGK